MLIVLICHLKFRYDLNDDNDDEKFNVVRETAEEEVFGR